MSRFVQYLKDTRREMAHVSWPTRTQTVSFTILVVLVSILIAVYLGAFDFLFTRALQTTFENVRFPQAADASPVLDTATTSTATTSGVINVTPIEQ